VTVPVLVWIGVALLAAWIAVTIVSVSLFDRERILTRWR
jgi:hypothetical protein